MTKDEARDYMHERGQEYATEAWGRDRSGKGWICPLCGSGTGNRGTGITTKDGIHFTCWSCGAFTNADIIDIIGLVEHIPETDHAAKFEAARRAFGLTLDEPGRTGGTGTAAAKVAKKPETGETGDFESFFLEANRHLSETDYHRGISLETLNRFRVGYAPAWRHPKAPQEVPTTPRLIIPTGPASYIARDTRRDIPPDQEAYKKQQVGSRGHRLFNAEALEEAKGPVFVAEGELDALSIIDAGGEAVTAGSAGRWGIVAEALKANPPAYPVIVAFDADEAGRESAGKLTQTLTAAGIRFRGYVPPAGHKDANEALMADWGAFEASVQAAIEDALKMGKSETLSLSAPQDTGAAGTEPLSKETYIAKESASASLQKIIERIRVGDKCPPIPTGLSTLDVILGGGLRPGLYMLGAVQSLGKTSLVMQVMDNVAAAGHDVLVFSLEMARDELITRSIARITYELSLKKQEPGRMAYSTVELLMGTAYNRDGAEGRKRILEAAEMYAEYADRIFIIEGVGDVTVAQMEEAVKRHIEITGQCPVVVCDYLQIVPAEETRGRTDKQNTDYNVVALKRLSRDLSIPVVVISSFNRQNYAEPLNPSAFKESGAVEYSADVLIGLQYQAMEYRAGDEKEGQRARRIAALIRHWNDAGKLGKPQGIHVKVMKNRQGYKDGAYLSYWPAFNYFECNTRADKSEREADDEWAQSVNGERKVGRGDRVH